MKISISTSTSKISEHARTMCRGSDGNGTSHYYWVQKCSADDNPANGTYSSGRCAVGHCNRRQGASVDSTGRLYQGPYCAERASLSVLRAFISTRVANNGRLDACKLGPHKCRKPKNRNEHYCKEREYYTITTTAYGY